MINITQPIEISVRHNYVQSYRIKALNLYEDKGQTITFKSYAQMAKYLGLSKQGLYNIIRKNMKPIDVISELSKKIAKQ